MVKNGNNKKSSKKASSIVKSSPAHGGNNKVPVIPANAAVDTRNLTPVSKRSFLTSGQPTDQGSFRVLNSYYVAIPLSATCFLTSMNQSILVIDNKAYASSQFFQDSALSQALNGNFDLNQSRNITLKIYNEPRNLTNILITLNRTLPPQLTELFKNCEIWQMRNVDKVSLREQLLETKIPIQHDIDGEWTFLEVQIQNLIAHIKSKIPSISFEIIRQRTSGSEGWRYCARVTYNPYADGTDDMVAQLNAKVSAQRVASEAN